MQYHVNRNGQDGLTRTERDILRRWDAGAGPREIARQTGLPRRRINSVITQLNGADEERRHRKAMAAGNATFLAALAAAQ